MGIIQSSNNDIDECSSERIFKNGKHLVELQARWIVIRPVCLRSGLCHP